MFGHKRAPSCTTTRLMCPETGAVTADSIWKLGSVYRPSVQRQSQVTFMALRTVAEKARIMRMRPFSTHGTERTTERITLLDLLTLFHANLHDDTRHRCANRARIGGCLLTGNRFHRGILVFDGHSTHLPCRTFSLIRQWFSICDSLHHSPQTRRHVAHGPRPPVQRPSIE